QCLDSFLMQQCDFDFEILIHDDASTDGTASIIQEYHNRYPSIIKPILQVENQYSKGVRGINLIYNFPRAEGKYIAMCEGDDYWEDPLKLQKQVSILDTNKNYSLVVGGYCSKHEYTKEEQNIIKESSKDCGDNGYSFNLHDTYKHWNTKVLTAVFVNDGDVFSRLAEYKYSRDVHLFYHLLKHGDGFYITQVLGVHRIHEGGVHSMVDKRKLAVGGFYIYKELYEKNRDEYTRKMYLNYLFIMMNIKIFNGKFAKQYELNLLELITASISLLKSPKDMLLLYQVFVNDNLKRKLKTFFQKS